MLDMVVATAIALIAAVTTVFLILLAINLALARKLRSIIPLAPEAVPGTVHSDRSSSSATTAHARSSS